jgi:uncharacterized protein (DUF1697 family)
MTSFVALLRGVNLGKRQLKMEDLRRVAAELGLDDPKTYIASGNLLFGSAKSETALKKQLEAALAEHMGARVGVMLRTAAELEAVAKANPFADEAQNFTVAIFLDEAPGKDALQAAKNVDGERMAVGKREIYVHYPRGQGQSRLRIPAADTGTARNMNTVAKLAELARERT